MDPKSLSAEHNFHSLAYAFTDYRAQGQTLEPVIVNIGPPPYGRLTPFNVYVALSRGTGRNNIRLLQDFEISLLQQHTSEFLQDWKTNASIT